eukprot:TRINITY_DN1334_c0_g1_i1.p1 TRINITY_DN1334_c0_g1~~TRINITY_DN1334_c0_g1_i1.p1  ORF type:complete len:502 (+),score=112.86 TRINITY_DN1334_c0_g1_i1:49-1554(+)
MEESATVHGDVSYRIGLNGLMTDMYQIRMAYTYFKTGKHTDRGIFEAFFRKAPFGGEFTIFCGLREVLLFLENFRLEDSHIEYLRKTMKFEDEEFYKWLKTINAKEVKVYAIQEGSLVFPRVPVMIVEGPLAIVQWLETPILNLINFASLVATNAARMRKAAGPTKSLMEFGLRRAQGPDGALTATQYSYVGGFDSTSNVFGGFAYGIPVVGTMAHAYVTSFQSLESAKDATLNGKSLYETTLKYRELLGYTKTNDSELGAFIAYAWQNPNSFFGLVDTYDTLKSGVPNFIVVSLALFELGYKPVGFRLDSGDLAVISVQSRELLRQVAEKQNVPGLAKIIISASNDINEAALLELQQKGHEIDSFGIGTNLVTCQKQPALGMVYKLVEINGIPRLKFSEENLKKTFPGKKNIYRAFLPDQKFAYCDIITADGEIIQTDGEVTLYRVNKDFEAVKVKIDRLERIDRVSWDGKYSQPLESVQTLRTRAVSYTHLTLPTIYSV